MGSARSGVARAAMIAAAAWSMAVPAPAGQNDLVRAQEPSRAGLPAGFLGERAQAFLAALESGDPGAVAPFQPRDMRERLSDDERAAFAAALKHARALFATPAGKFQRVALERAPRIELLPSDARRVVASWELELRSGEGAEALLHGVRLRFGAEREEGETREGAQPPAADAKAHWPVAEFDLELESVQPATGRVIPELDLAPVTLTGSLSELMFGAEARGVLERSAAPFAREVLTLDALELDPASSGGALVEAVRTAIAAKDGAALLAAIHLEEGAETPDAKTLAEALSVSTGLDERLRAFVRPGPLPRSATRGAIEVVTSAGTYLVEWSKKRGRWALDDLAFEPAVAKDGAVLHLRELLSR
jgi:hypothetical protein